MTKIKKRYLVLFTAVAMLVSFLALPISQASAQLFEGAKEATCNGVDLNSGSQPCDQSSGAKITSLIATIINIVSIVVGVVAVVMLIIGGFKFITSQGDSNSVASARNTIMYALIGLVVVVLAQFIVRFVLARTVVKPLATPAAITTPFLF